MQITYCINYPEMSELAASLVQESIRQKPGLLLCAATGSSPEGLYSELAKQASREKELFSALRILKLDEWGGLPENHPATCEYYLKTRLLDPLGIGRGRYISFHSDPEDPEKECGRIHDRLQKEGPIDVCILGLGRNGHLGLNEPAAHLEPRCHVAVLSEESLGHPMITSLAKKPAYGLTLGMQDILASRRIIMLVSGHDKKQMVEKFLEGTVSGELPASFLWEHGRVDCLIDRRILD